MFYATAGQQATQPPPPPGARAPSSQMSQGGGGGVQPQNQSGFPPIAGVGAAGGMGRSSGPPGFSGRSSGGSLSRPPSCSFHWPWSGPAGLHPIDLEVYVP